MIPVGLASLCVSGLLLDRAGERGVGERVGEVSFDCFSAIRTEDKAATAAALCEPDRGLLPGLDATGFGAEDELNAEFKAAKAEALCVGPPRFVPLDLG